MQKMPATKKKWRGSVSLPPEIHAFLKGCGPNRSAAITDLLTRSQEYKAWAKKKSKTKA